MARTEYVFGPFRLDVGGRQLFRESLTVALPPKALDLLIHLIEHAGEVLTRDQLFAALWPDTYVDDHALSVQIRELRKALTDDVRQPQYIETRYRRGYCFKALVTRRSEAAAGIAAAAGRVYPLPLGSAAEPVPARMAAAVPETHYTRSGDANIAYQVLGDGPVDLVFVMGWVSHLEYFWTEPRFASFLRRLATFSRVILFDKRGTGLSDRVPVNQLPTIEQRMADLHAVMDATGSTRAVICGVSEGGCMSAVFAATHPENTLGLIMISSYAKRTWSPDYPWAPTREERQPFLDEIRDHWGGPVGIEQRAPSLAHDPAFRDWWATYLRMGASPGAALAITRMCTEFDVRDALPLVGVPTLVIHRELDHCLRLEEGRYLAAHIPGARLAVVPGEDHLPFVGDQEPILGEVERFMAQARANLDAGRVLATVLVASCSPSAETPAGPAEFETQLRSHLSLFRATRSRYCDGRTTAVFDGPARAVRFACAIHRTAESLGLESRAGLHTGECILRDAEVEGNAMAVAEQIHARAASGEILVSGTVRDLAAGSGIAFQPVGRFEAAGVGEWQLLAVRPE